MNKEDWRKFGEIQYLRGRLDEMFKIDQMVDLDMSGGRKVDARISKYLDKLERGLEMYMNTTESAISGSKQSAPDPLMREGWDRIDWPSFFNDLEKENPLNQ